MGPRLFRRGNLNGGYRALPQGAASMGPRLFRRGNAVRMTWVAVGDALQWGHVFSDVEIGCAGGGSGQRGVLQWGHVFSDVEIG